RTSPTPPTAGPGSASSSAARRRRSATTMPTRSSPTAERSLRLRAGTSGWSYDAWKGPFYPAELPSREMLGFYAARLPSVEVNNTFYRLPKATVLETWAAQVPDCFRFALKASRRITHLKRRKELAGGTG